jgi:hypothetical protein
MCIVAEYLVDAILPSLSLLMYLNLPPSRHLCPCGNKLQCPGHVEHAWALGLPLRSSQANSQRLTQSNAYQVCILVGNFRGDHMFLIDSCAPHPLNPLPPPSYIPSRLRCSPIFYLANFFHFRYESILLHFSGPLRRCSPGLQRQNGEQLSRSSLRQAT